MLDQMVDRVAAEDLDPLALHDFRDCRAELHGGFPPQGPADVQPGLSDPSWNRNRGCGKARFAAAREALICAGHRCLRKNDAAYRHLLTARSACPCTCR